MRRLLQILLLTIIGLSFAMPASSAILFYEDFEDALDFTPPKDWAKDGKHGSQERTTEQVRAGTYGYKFSLTRYDSGDYREELTLRNTFNGGSSKFTIGNEYWIGFSIFLSASYQSPQDSGGWMIHFQIHSSEDDAPTCDWKEGIRNPIMVIKTNYNSSNWHSWIQWDDQQCTPLQKVGVEIAGYEYDAFVPGEWVDFVINVRWNYEDAGNGLLKVWKNGVLVTERNGPNCFNDVEGPWAKIGIYGNPGQDQTAIIYYDEFRIGDNNSSYAEVAPGMAIFNACPTQGSAGISITTDLNWANPTSTTNIDLLFDKKSEHDPPTTVRLNDQNVETWDCGTLDYSTEYAWRVDVNYTGGTETGTVYYFTTTAEANPPIPAVGMNYCPNGVVGSYCSKGINVQ